MINFKVTRDVLETLSNQEQIFRFPESDGMCPLTFSARIQKKNCSSIPDASPCFGVFSAPLALPVSLSICLNVGGKTQVSALFETRPIKAAAGCAVSSKQRAGFHQTGEVKRHSEDIRQARSQRGRISFSVTRAGNFYVTGSSFIVAGQNTNR